MPVKRRLQRRLPPGSADFIRALFREWTQPKKSGQPLIIIEGNEGELRHVYVIWDRWGKLNQTDRSEIIMDVVENLAGDHRIKDPVTVAMGLTTEEAKRMGIKQR